MAPHQGMLTLVPTVTVVVVPSSGTMLTVTPSSTNMTCPTENTCLTLSEYAQHYSEYFNHSNITLQFLPGNHTLDVDLTVTSIHTQYLEILGNTSPTPTILHAVMMLGLRSGTFQKWELVTWCSFLVEVVIGHSIHSWNCSTTQFDLVQSGSLKSPTVSSVIAFPLQLG